MKRLIPEFTMAVVACPTNCLKPGHRVARLPALAGRRCAVEPQQPHYQKHDSVGLGPYKIAIEASRERNMVQVDTINILA